MSNGYELPIKSKDEDFFDRWRLASEIWSLISNAPADWSVRIGVYGKWGEGKTSVLYFLQELAKKDNHVVVWFNPWAIQDRDTLWASFAGTVISALADAGIKVKGEKLLKAKQFARKAVDPIKKASEFHAYSKAIVGGALSVLSRFLAIDSKTFQSIKDGLGNRRLIVLVDDLDRSSQKLLPELLLSLREVLDLPRMVFVLAFDVEIVANALAHEYTAWGRGEEFLEKIIDFPIILPTPSDEQIQRLLDSELNRNFPFVDRKAIANIFDALPRNPRKLKLLLRYIWSLKKQIERHDSSELDWNTIILWQLFKIESAHAARLFSELPEIIEILATWRFYLKSDGEGESEQHKKVISSLEQILKVVRINDSDPRFERIPRLIKLLGEKNSLDNPEQFLYQINLLDKPHAVTWKEFGTLIEAWKSSRSLGHVDRWIREHAEKVSTTTAAVAREVFITTIGHRQKRLEDASAAGSLEEHSGIMSEVASARELLESLFVSGLPCVGGSFFRTPQGFGLIWKMYQTWIHFRKNEGDKKEREAEEVFLKKCSELTQSGASGYMDVLAPWEEETFPSEDHGRLINEQKKKLGDLIEPYVADALIELLRTKGGVASLWGRDSNTPEKYTMFHAGGPLWTEPRKTTVLRILATASSSLDIHQNSFELLQMASYGAERGLGFAYAHAQVEKFVADKEIAGAIWKAATARPIQYRLHHKIRDTRKQLARIAGADDHLPWPEWLGKEEATMPVAGDTNGVGA